MEGGDVEIRWEGSGPVRDRDEARYESEYDCIHSDSREQGSNL